MTNRWDELQNDFSGGEIGPQLLMREDTELHKKACIEMLNFQPTMHGTAQRTPGTKFLFEVESANLAQNKARIFPFRTPENKKALLLMTPGLYTGPTLTTPGTISVIEDPSVLLDASTDENYVPDLAPIQQYKPLLSNGGFDKGEEEWEFEPNYYTDSTGDSLGWNFDIQPSASRLTVRFKNNSDSVATGTLERVYSLAADAEFIELRPDIVYGNFAAPFTTADLPYIMTLKVGTTQGGSDLLDIDLSDLELAQRYRTISQFNGSNFTAGTNIYIKLTLTALEADGGGISNTPVITVWGIQLWGKIDVDPQERAVTGDVPYGLLDLPNVHYVQSPYPKDPVEPSDIGKPMIFTHPLYPPKVLYFNGTNYQFVDYSTLATNPPAQWAATRYPATCTSYIGRLVFAGSNDNVVSGGSGETASETVWTTEVGDWFAFTDFTNLTEVLPTDSVEFVATVRSPIQWAYGQKDLLIGATEVEYKASGEGIFAPGDLGIYIQSTHGSTNVQPVAMGQYVLFPGDNGTRVRAMQYVDEDAGWTSPDMNLAHPSLLQRGITRMVRMRNPHQMCVVLRGDGQLCVLNVDTNANLAGWHRQTIGNKVIDMCVLPDGDNGSDTLYLLVNRKIEGENRVYCEAIVNWRYNEDWVYQNSYLNIVYDTPQTTIAGLSHLRGKYVQILADDNWYNTVLVDENGECQIDDGLGGYIEVERVTVGLSNPCILRTMPLVTQDPGSLKRFSQVSVRTLGSRRAQINFERNADRAPVTWQDDTQGPDLVYDNTILTLGSDRSAVINVREHIPVRLEVVGIFGKVEAGSL